MLTRATRRIARIARGGVGRIARVEPLSYLPPPRRRARTRPRVGVVGFYGHGNYGDELFLEVFREHLGSEFDLGPHLPGSGTRSMTHRLGGAVRAADAILIGGGDILIPWSTDDAYWNRTYLRRPVFVAGVGVPRWREPVPGAVRRLDAFLGHANVRFIGTRDPESTAWIDEHLHPAVPVTTAPDLVCGLSLPAVERPGGQPVLGVAVRSRRQPDDLSHVRALCLRGIELGYRVRRIVLATGRVRERDELATAGLDLPDTELIATDDLAAISRAIGECTVLASMKFHGVVVATMYGVPAIALMPTTKTKNFLRGIDRLDLLSAYSRPELPALLREDLPPIAATTRDRLRAAAVAHLGDLRAAIGRATAAGGDGP